MPEITIEVRGGAVPVARDQLRAEVERLERDGKRISGIRYPGWAANELGIVPDAGIGNAGRYGQHRAAQRTDMIDAVVIVFED